MPVALYGFVVVSDLISALQASRQPAQEVIVRPRELYKASQTPQRFTYPPSAFSAKMSCTDDLTAEDLTTNVTTEVLERVTAGEGSNTNLWPNINVAWYVLTTAAARLCLLCPATQPVHTVFSGPRAIRVKGCS